METNTFLPYVYKVTNLTTGEFYIGMKITPGEIGVDYFTSSTNKEFKSDFKKNPQNYLCEKLFTGNQADVVLKESELIYNSKDNPLILNKAFNNGHVFLIEIRPHTAEQNKKQSESMKGHTPWNKGRRNVYSDEARRKMGIANKGKEPPNKGKKASDDTCRKLSDSHLGQEPWNKGLKATDKAKKNQSLAHLGQKAHNTGKRCFNDGNHNVYAYECPEGFVPGMAKKTKDK